MRLLLTAIGIGCSFAVMAQTTTVYTTQTTWTVPAHVSSISVKVYGGGGGTGGQDCGAGCSNAAAGNVGFIQASFSVAPGNVVGINPGAQGVNGSSAATASGGGNGGVATYNVAYNGGKGGNAGPSGSSGGGGGGGGATVLTIASIIKVVAGGGGGGGGMANQAGSGSNGTNTYTPNGTSNTGGTGTSPSGDGGGGGGGGGGNFGALGGVTHAAGSEQAGDGGNLGGNLISGAIATVTNNNIAWTSGGRIDITYTATLPVEWLSFTAASQHNGSILLNWSTATELNTRSYTVQRSINANEWTILGTVPAAGNAATTTNYHFSDQTAVSNTWYYRLAQTDIDGTITFSKTLICSTGGPRVKIYPNPVERGSINVSLTAAAEVKIYNSNGINLLHKNLPAGESQLNLSNFKTGVYFLKAGEQKIVFIVK